MHFVLKTTVSFVTRGTRFRCSLSLREKWKTVESMVREEQDHLIFIAAAQNSAHTESTLTTNTRRFRRPLQ